MWQQLNGIDSFVASLHQFESFCLRDEQRNYARCYWPVVDSSLYGTRINGQKLINSIGVKSPATANTNKPTKRKTIFVLSLYLSQLRLMVTFTQIHYLTDCEAAVRFYSSLKYTTLCTSIKTRNCKISPYLLVAVEQKII